MKKILAFALALMLILSLAACGGKTEPEAKPTEHTSGKTEDLMDYSVDGTFVIVTVKAELNYSESPWVGICPVGEYLSEEEADSVDETYAYPEEGSSTVTLDISSIENGNWLLVLCDSDNGENAKVLAAVPITIG